MEKSSKRSSKHSSKRKQPSLDLTKPVERPRTPFGVLFRMFVIGSIAVGASVYAVYRHYYVPRPSMLMPRPTATADEAEPLPPGFVPVPELVPVPAPSEPPSGAPSGAPSR